MVSTSSSNLDENLLSYIVLKVTLELLKVTFELFIFYSIIIIIALSIIFILSHILKYIKTKRWKKYTTRIRLIYYSFTIFGSGFIPYFYDSIPSFYCYLAFLVILVISIYIFRCFYLKSKEDKLEFILDFFVVCFVILCIRNGWIIIFSILSIFMPSYAAYFTFLTSIVLTSWINLIFPDLLLPDMKALNSNWSSFGDPLYMNNPEAPIDTNAQTQLGITRLIDFFIPQIPGNTAYVKDVLPKELPSWSFYTIERLELMFGTNPIQEQFNTFKALEFNPARNYLLPIDYREFKHYSESQLSLFKEIIVRDDVNLEYIHLNYFQRENLQDGVYIVLSNSKGNTIYRYALDIQLPPRTSTCIYVKPNENFEDYNTAYKHHGNTLLYWKDSQGRYLPMFISKSTGYSINYESESARFYIYENGTLKPHTWATLAKMRFAAERGGGGSNLCKRY